MGKRLVYRMSDRLPIDWVSRKPGMRQAPEKQGVAYPLRKKDPEAYRAGFKLADGYVGVLNHRQSLA